MTLTIESLYKRSKEYHGAMSFDTLTVGCYFEHGLDRVDNKPYMCAIGCQLSNPKEVDNLVNSNGDYLLDEILNSKYTADYLMLDDWLDRLAHSSGEVVEFAEEMQSIHDQSETVEEYLVWLDELYEECK